MSELMSTLFGDTAMDVLLVQWLPLFTVAAVPVLSVLIKLLECHGHEHQHRVGSRILRRVVTAVQADIRMHKTVPKSYQKAHQARSSVAGAASFKTGSPNGNALKA
uniref:Uncharacterized protein n=1 Tax=Haptolina brevifila TaxID=156173 RepID=A0A7S2II28_9EUKA|mmetsp:Transcript_66095/g.131091  ORF Transcript_66095/g.131091 Transcript_66095/m.131091 type:complete len:106 (+) Transcript_66095:67-384(+)|eukprot:CAMPEP_0174719886 /NCGR_PEP_ID=MMETSP1094-20130205/32211_1 /TAXON_ID=156173 /ORGANISM="Chrysochromulina brevifilum, Strain UTEX LB 985" /LENGTH=105 /DNA_ID=CAMNT_0015920277 /DNA_START=54 /DNA_END=371 /DNA_ORIENTATION=-